MWNNTGTGKGDTKEVTLIGSMILFTDILYNYKQIKAQSEEIKEYSRHFEKCYT